MSVIGLTKPTLKSALPRLLRANIIRIWFTFIGIGIAFSIGNVSGHSFDELRLVCPVRLWAVLFFLAALGMLVSEVLQRIDVMRVCMTIAGSAMVFIAGADLYTFFFDGKAGLFAAVAYLAIAVAVFQAVIELAKWD